MDFDLPCEDEWVHASGTRGHLYLEGARQAWTDNPSWMDFLDLSSPIRDLKVAERDLYLHHWAPWLEADRYLDVGCGIGRFTSALMDRNASVWGVDADLESLRRCAWHAVNRPGALDLHWSSINALPDVEVDVAICVEVLCYVPKAREALRNIVARVRPGGTVLLSVEARWGWAASEDAPAGGIDRALDGDGVVHIPGDRWVQTYRQADVEALMTHAGLRVESVVPMMYLTDGPLERVMPQSASIEDLVALEARCRAHRVWGPMNRIWSAAGTKPG